MARCVKEPSIDFQSTLELGLDGVPEVLRLCAEQDPVAEAIASDAEEWQDRIVWVTF